MFNLKVGDFFTVTGWKSGNDKSYIGDCFKANVIDENLVRVCRYRSHIGYEYFTLDLGKVSIRRLSNAFVRDVLMRPEDRKTDCFCSNKLNEFCCKSFFSQWTREIVLAWERFKAGA